VRQAIADAKQCRSAKRGAAVVRWTSAIVFLAFGASKFVNHASELASFRRYALPAPGVFVYLIGVLEISGGLLLASGRLVRLAALALAGDMVGAIVVSGIARGEDISLTLAPLLLVAMIFLVSVGPTRRSKDRDVRMTSRASRRRRTNAG
jgi:putative oxidoreductase